MVILALLCILPLSKFFRFLCDSARYAPGFCFGGYMIIVLSLLVAILGLLAYFMASNPKTVEAGRIAYFAGLLAFLIQVAAHPIGILK